VRMGMESVESLLDKNAESAKMSTGVLNGRF
jgi:hypothetical protein